MSLRQEYANPDKEKKHKLAAIATVQYTVRGVEECTVVIEYEDLSQDRVSRDRLVLAPSPPEVILSDAPVRADSRREIVLPRALTSRGFADLSPGEEAQSRSVRLRTQIETSERKPEHAQHQGGGKFSSEKSGTAVEDATRTTERRYFSEQRRLARYTTLSKHVR